MATIAFGLPTPNKVNIRIYDGAGRQVWVHVRGEAYGQVMHKVQWEGRSDSAQAAAAVISFGQLDAAVFQATERMTLLQ